MYVNKQAMASVALSKSSCAAVVQEGPAYAEAFFNVLRSVTKEDTVQYVLAILDQMVAGGVLGTWCTS